MDPSTAERALHDLIQRLAALERRDERLERENQQLRAEMAALYASMTRQAASPAASTPEPDPTPIERMSRRWVLRRAMQSTAAAVVAGVLVQADKRDAVAGHATQNVHVNALVAHQVNVSNDSGEVALNSSTNSAHTAAASGRNTSSGPGVEGTSTSGTGVKGSGSVGVWGAGTGSSGVFGSNSGSGAGVEGYNSAGVGVIGTGKIGTHGTSSEPWHGAVYGEHTGTEGYGVVGDASGTLSAAMLGRNTVGDAIRGEGKTGLRGVSPNGTGVFGEGGTGYGGVFKGARAQVRLTPTGRIGKPTTGSHQIGELYLDKNGALFICTANGTPGTWRKVSTTT